MFCTCSYTVDTPESKYGHSLACEGWDLQALQSPVLPSCQTQHKLQEPRKGGFTSFSFLLHFTQKLHFSNWYLLGNPRTTLKEHFVTGETEGYGDEISTCRGEPSEAVTVSGHAS